MEAATCKFPEWVSKEIIDFHAEQGVTHLFDWQRKLLEDALQCEEQNVVFSAPTSAGKSIVAELLAWKVASSGKKVLFVLPYISVAREKLYQIQKCWRRDNLPVCSFIGPNASNPNEWVAAVCTIEKAASLINRALGEDWFDDIGMIVVDELHMIFDSSRGSHIEHMLSKVLLWNSRKNQKVRIIGMSATIPELKRIGDWLEAKVFEANFRPIQLRNHIVIGKEMKSLENEKEVIHEFLDDPLITLVEESFMKNQQTLVMVSSKSDAEKTAIEIYQKLRSILKSENGKLIMNRLKERGDGLYFTKHGLERNGCKDSCLIGILAYAVAFHHAGLTMEERECVELGFREKTVIILVATSTLASGVNLPAERVIIKAQPRGPSALTLLSYRQMVGRAGRTGHSTRGESYLIVKKDDEEAVNKIINNSIDSNIQTRSRGSDKSSLSRFILEGICTGLTTTKEQIVHLCSLLLFSFEYSNRSDVSINELIVNSFVSCDDEEILSPTQLGRAAIASSLPPEAALHIFKDLNVASKSIALDTELHMLYLVTPINVSVWQDCDWDHMFTLFTKLQPDQRRIAKLVGASEKFILERIKGNQNEDQLKLHTRFFSSLALFDLINETPIYDVSQKYKISRGCLQTIQSQSATYAAMIVAFCLRLGWTYLKALLDGFAMRLMFGIRSELSELVHIDGIDGQRARVLHEKGITCLSHLSACEPSKLAHYLTLAVPYSSLNSNDGLGEWLFGEPRMRLNDASRILKERARNALMRRILELGITVELPKENEIEDFQESCDSGLPDSCPLEEGVKMEEMTKSVSEISLIESDSENSEMNFIKLEVKEEDYDSEVEDTVIECLDTSLLKLKAPKDDNFIRRLSMTFSPAGRRRSILSNSYMEDSFDKPVPGCIPFNFITPKREVKDESFEDSFDRPVPGSTVFKMKRNILSPLNTSVHSESDNRSFDVFGTPPEIIKNSLKHPRVSNFKQIESPLASLISSPIQKHPKFDTTQFRLEDVCHDEKEWKRWVKSTLSLKNGCSIHTTSSIGYGNGVVVSTESGTTFIPLKDKFKIIPSPNTLLFNSFAKCVVSLEERLEYLKTLAQSMEVSIFSLKVAFELFEKFQIQVFIAHLNHLVPDCDSESFDDHEDLFPILIGRCAPWNFDILEEWKSHNDIHRAALEAFAFRKIFESFGTSEDSFKLEMMSCRIVLKMFYNGIEFDRKLCQTFIQKLRRDIEVLEEQIWRMAHGKFNIDSSHDVSNVLFNRLGLVYPETSQTKQNLRHLPTNKQILEKMTEQHEVVRKIIEYRHKQHTFSQCAIPLSKYEKRIHCWFEMCTATGRILTGKPNLQNVPKKVSPDGMSARKLFIATPGTILIGADYKQLELRVLAHLSNDVTLVNLISEERDLFEELANEWSFPRDAVKQMCYGLIYGMAAKSLAELTSMTVEEAEKMLRKFFDMFPGIKSYINDTKRKAAEEEYVETVLKRKKIIKMMNVNGEEKARLERVAVNYTIQGSASEIFKQAIVDIDTKIRVFSARIVLTIHDEVLVESPAEYCHETSKIIQDCMENSLSHLLRVPMRVSLKTATNWGDLK